MIPRYVLGLVMLLVALTVCSLAAPGEKIPLTVSSKDAEMQFLKGRTLVDNLRLTDAIPHFQKAVEIDPAFAMAHLYLAQTAPTAKVFFAELDKAVENSKRVSKAEQLWINGVRAGAYADPITQRKLYKELVEMFPADERAQTLLGISYFGQQEYADAARHLKKATEIAPDFAPAYNQLGYAYRFLGDYAKAEETFRRYTELLPDDPNPFDSFGELLLKMGRFDEAIVQYRKALSINEHFANSYTGIAAALMYQGKHADARTEMQKAFSIARNDGEKRAALFALAVIAMDEGQTELAMQEMQKQYAIAEAIHDPAAMAGDLVLTGNILLQVGNAEQARARYDKALATIKSSKLAAEVKDNAALIYHYNIGRVATVKGDLESARKEADLFRKGVEVKGNQNQIRLSHELAGMIALAEKQHGKAIDELRQANQQDPRILYGLARACQADGQKEEARKYAQAAAKFNGLPFLNYAYVRLKAEQLLTTL